MAIKVLIADDVTETRENIKRILELDSETVVVGLAANGHEAIEKTRKYQPDVVLLDIQMPELDGISAAARIKAASPKTSIIMMSVQDDRDYLRRAMNAGARDYIIKPFKTDELTEAIRSAYKAEYRTELVREMGAPSATEPKVLAVWGTKGGVGKTTLAVNLAVALSQLSGEEVALADFSLQFGDVCAFLNLLPKHTLADLCQSPDGRIDAQALEAALTGCKGLPLKVLAAPARPEYADLVTPEKVEGIMSQFKQLFTWTVVDLGSSVSEVTLAVLEQATSILLVTNLDITSVKNTKLTIELMEALRLQHKTKIVANGVSPEWGLEWTEVERVLGVPLAYKIPASPKVAVDAVNKGLPLVNASPSAGISMAILEMVQNLTGKTKQDRKGKGAGAARGLWASSFF